MRPEADVQGMISQRLRHPLPVVAGAATALALTAASLALTSTASAGVTAPSMSIRTGGGALDGATEAAGFTAALGGTPGQIAYVKWILDGTYLGKDSAAPYQLTLAKPLVGQHTLRARIHSPDGTQTRVDATFTGTTGKVVVPPTAAPTTRPTTAPATTPPVSTPPTGGATTVHVSDGTSLVAALSAAKPGTTIVLADGTYTSKAPFTIAATCAATAPCTLIGSRAALLDGAGYSGHYGLYLLHASYWTLSGFTVTNASKGIVTDTSSHNTITGVQVSFVGDEGIHLRDFSTDNVVSGNLVHDTGQKAPQYGEGVYVGSAKSNWGSYSGGVPDNSDRNRILGNTIYRTGAEDVDIKEGTTGGTLANNSFNGAGMSGQNFADSWVDVKGNSWTITGNTGVNSINDGFQSHVVLAGWGQDNVFSANTAAVNSTGYGFDIQSAATSHSVVSCTNVVTGAAAGMANTPCTP